MLPPENAAMKGEVSYGNREGTKSEQIYRRRICGEKQMRYQHAARQAGYHQCGAEHEVRQEYYCADLRAH